MLTISLNPWTFEYFKGSLNVLRGETKQISDIRKVAGGDKWTLLAHFETSNELFIKVHALATDRFTLFIERNPTEPNSQVYLMGIHLDSSRRPLWIEPRPHLIKFQIPPFRTVIMPLVDLFPALECRLFERPRPSEISCHLEYVPAIEQRADHTYSIIEISLVANKLQLIVSHSFSTNNFTLLCEEKLSQDTYENPILKAALHSLEDHPSDGCSCQRKGYLTSVLEFDVEKMIAMKPSRILLFGNHRGGFEGAIIRLEDGVKTLESSLNDYR